MTTIYQHVFLAILFEDIVSVSRSLKQNEEYFEQESFLLAFF